jgi:hypothetical protein
MRPRPFSRYTHPIISLAFHRSKLCRTRPCWRRKYGYGFARSARGSPRTSRRPFAAVAPGDRGCGLAVELYPLARRLNRRRVRPILPSLQSPKTTRRLIVGGIPLNIPVGLNPSFPCEGLHGLLERVVRSDWKSAFRGEERYSVADDIPKRTSIYVMADCCFVAHGLELGKRLPRESTPLRATCQNRVRSAKQPRTLRHNW